MPIILYEVIVLVTTAHRLVCLASIVNEMLMSETCFVKKLAFSHFHTKLLIQSSCMLFLSDRSDQQEINDLQLNRLCNPTECLQ